MGVPGRVQKRNRGGRCAGRGQQPTKSRRGKRPARRSEDCLVRMPRPKSPQPMRPGGTDPPRLQAAATAHWTPKSFSICSALLLTPHGALWDSFGRICRNVPDRSSSLKEVPRRSKWAQPDRPKPSAAAAATYHWAFRDMVIDTESKKGVLHRPAYLRNRQGRGVSQNCHGVSRAVSPRETP